MDITITINKANLTPEAWEGFLSQNPPRVAEDESPPDLSTDEAKAAYIAEVLADRVDFDCRRGADLNARRVAAEAARDLPPVVDRPDRG